MCRRGRCWGQALSAGIVVGTLDMALWDALARDGRSPSVLLGGELRPLPPYDSFGMLDRQFDLPWLEASVASGFKAIKIKLGTGDVESAVAIVSRAGQSATACG